MTPSSSLKLLTPIPRRKIKKLAAAYGSPLWDNNGKYLGISTESGALQSRLLRTGLWKGSFVNSKGEAGLGFKDFKCMNVALLAKQAWRLVNEENNLWVRVLKGNTSRTAPFGKLKRGLHLGAGKAFLSRGIFWLKIAFGKWEMVSSSTYRGTHWFLAAVVSLGQHHLQFKKWQISYYWES
ncbi:hypothetical protein RHSIM_Rhsim07G0018500 [Rhododendron simsii]|uniref:Uncharacterized protein n=1 Tax=Rhododendron simsii TaxID=118357 RepID=A0A834GQT1_RHOSS|nr:hypothetical protein RHSIM_Rhsim07G0018500 [Rhododendron simsii]